MRVLRLGCLAVALPGLAAEVSAVAAPRAPPPPPPRVAKWYPLDAGAVCLNGDGASVYAFHEPADAGTSNDWVIEVGGPPELNWCVSEAACAQFGHPSAPGTTCATNKTLCPRNTTFLGFGGPQGW